MKMSYPVSQTDACKAREHTGALMREKMMLAVKQKRKNIIITILGW